MLIDTHAHLNFREYQNELDDVIQRSFDNKTWIITVGSTYDSSKKAIKISEKFGKGIWSAVGLHPLHLIKDVEETAVFDKEEHSFITPKEDFSYDKYKNLVQSSSSVVAIGEVGLDFYRMEDQDNPIEKVKEKQVKVFKEFIRLSQEVDKPLILHCRDYEEDPGGAYDLMIDILSPKPKALSPKPRGVIHCFGGNATHARKFLDLGFYIGVTGIVTFKNAKDLQEIVADIPLDKILIETDSPFLAPDPYRGKKNEPTFVRYVCQKVADLKEVTFDKVENETFENAVKLFKL